jgi:biotin transport system substrate-specific component
METPTCQVGNSVFELPVSFQNKAQKNNTIMHESSLTSLHRLVWTALAAALIAIGAFLQFPIGPVPITMQPFFVFLSGYLLGPLYGAGAVLLYITAGCLGLPFFAGGKSGFAHLLGPTGGYLIGFVAAAAICGLAVRKKDALPEWLPAALCGFFAILATYGIGTTRLAMVLDFSLTKAVAVGVTPFILPDFIKMFLAIACRRYLKRYGLIPQNTV